MEYRTEQAVLPSFGQVEKVIVEGRWVGFLRRLPRTPDQAIGEVWMAHYGGLGGHGVNSKQEGLQKIVSYAQEHPDYVMQ